MTEIQDEVLENLKLDKAWEENETEAIKVKVELIRTLRTLQSSSNNWFDYNRLNNMILKIKDRDFIYID